MRTTAASLAIASTAAPCVRSDGSGGERVHGFDRAGRRLATVGVAIIALGGLMAGCGSSSEKGSDTTATASPASRPSSTTAPSADLTATVKADPKLGTVLADPSGKTLYTLTKDAKAVPCTGPCLTVWPALGLASGATEPTAPEGVTLTAVDGPEGAKLVAADDLPLYTFAGDGSAADAKGEGIASFGGTWHVVKTSAAVTPDAAGGNTTPATGETTTTGGY